MQFFRKYNTQAKIRIPIIKFGTPDFAVGADWTPAAGDVKVSKDGGSANNIGTLPTAIAMGNGAIWEFTISATEMQAAEITVTVVDSATKAVQDQAISIISFGNASAGIVVDLSDAVRAGLTALPNANAEAAGGLYTRGAGAGQINQSTNGQVDTTVQTNNDKTGYTLAADFRIKKNTALANFMFRMTDSSDHVSPKTGLTVSGAVSKDGAAFGSLTNSVSEVSNGWYKVNLAAGDVNADIVALKFTASGADQLDMTVVTQTE